ncbi:MAG: 3-deoxy-manno-octulosonate cytidylyltransferase [Cytophagaceae bacterium]|nr:3-deoxy-manno-octulosonate cytidylyltransferase [Cytophagaceae bacterium]
MRILGVIPARYASTRFPGKLLKEIGGKSIIRMVYEQCLKTKSLIRVVVATDNELVFDHVQSFGGEVIMTLESHQSGTDRCAEVAKKLHGNTDFDFLVNIQGDEPLIDPETIDSLCSQLDIDTQILTAYKTIKTLDELLNPNLVKVVLGEKNQALYFSRSPIPHIRGVEIDHWLVRNDFYQHIGLYVFSVEVLEKIVRFPVSKLENLEKLEQLRWLSNGFNIKAVEVESDSIGIDTPEDFEALRQFLQGK